MNWWQDQASGLASMPSAASKNGPAHPLSGSIARAIATAFGGLEPAATKRFDDLERNAFDLENESQMPPAYQRRSPVGYRDALPLGIAAGIAKIFGIEDSEIAEGFQGFYGGRQEAEERDYQNFMAEDERRRQALAIQARQKQFEAQKLSQAMDRHNESVGRAREQARLFERRLSFGGNAAESLRQRLQADDPQAWDLHDRNPGALAGLSDAAAEPRGASGFDLGSRQMLELSRQNPMKFNEIVDTIKRASPLDFDAKQKFDYAVSLFEPSRRDSFATAYAAYLNAIAAGAAPSSELAEGLVTLIEDQLERWAELAHIHPEANELLERLFDFSEGLRFRSPERTPHVRAAESAKAAFGSTLGGAQARVRRVQ